jgi:hypothetical protein
MKGDFTRFGFDSSKHYSRVLQQQGRVALDSDANESTAILLHHLRTLTRDLFGPFGGPADGGFALGLDQSGNAPVLWIGPGHYYVYGILCENEAWANYAQQPDYTPAAPDPSGAGGDALLAWLRNPVDSQRFWIYLDVWERHVTWIEDDSIREPALGGPDTCSRGKAVWQVKALPWNPDWGDFNGSDACGAPLPALQTLGGGRMAARVDPGPAFTDPCVISPTASYRGAENHLYRVEVHTGGDAGTATFKWSRDNGSVATRWLGMGSDANSIIVKSGRGFSAEDWVELSHDALELAGLPGQLVRLSVVDGDQLTIDAASIPVSAPMTWSASLSNPKVRRWDQRTNDVIGLRDGAVPITESSSTQVTWIDLEDGVQVSFAGGGQYRSGDYWLIPARVATGGVQWPLDGVQPALLTPQGVVHHYAPLGVLFSSDGLRLNLCRRCVAVSPIDCNAVAGPARAETATVGTTAVAAPVQVKEARATRRRRPA